LGNVTVNVADLPLAIWGVLFPAISKSRGRVPLFTIWKITFPGGAAIGADSSLESVIVMTIVVDPARASAAGAAETSRTAAATHELGTTPGRAPKSFATPPRRVWRQ
jgi:hypothetical protein